MVGRGLAPHMREQLEDYKRAAATMDTFRDYWDLEEDLERDLEFLRDVIARERYSVRKLKRKLARLDWRRELRGYELPISRRFLVEDIEETQRRLEPLVAIRDEMRAGLRELKRQLKF